MRLSIPNCSQSPLGRYHISMQCKYKTQQNTVWDFSLNRPHWADSVIESPCPDVCLSVCGYVSSGALFFLQTNK